MTPKEKKAQQAILTLAHYEFEKGLNLHAFFKTHDHQIGEDLVQDTFMKTWTYLARGGKIDMMKAFLYHVLNNLIIDQYRKKKTTSLDVLLEKGFEPSIDDFISLFNILDGKVAILLISKLPKPYRQVIHMRYVKDLTLKEISVLTGKSKNTVAVQIHRGLTKLKVLYKPNAKNN